MSEVIRVEDLSVGVLAEDKSLAGFSCSDQDHSGIDDFLHREALLYQWENMGVTYTFYHGDDLAGFATVSMNSIHDSAASDPKDRKFRKKIPVVLIGQLGVDDRFRRRGVGRFICEWCYGKAVSLSREVGYRYVALHAERQLTGFYERCGFETTDPRKKTVLMVRKTARL